MVLLGLQTATDAEIWEYAKLHNYVVVSRDVDFLDLSLLTGSPPKLIRLRTKNLSRTATLSVLLTNQQLIEQVLIDESQPYVEIVHAL